MSEWASGLLGLGGWACGRADGVEGGWEKKTAISHGYSTSHRRRDHDIRQKVRRHFRTPSDELVHPVQRSQTKAHVFQVSPCVSRSGSLFHLLACACGFLLFATSSSSAPCPAARGAGLLGRKCTVFEHAVENATEG